MKNRKLDSRKRYLLAFVIGTFVFLFVFSIAYSISYLEFKQISQMQDEMIYEIFKDRLSYSLFDKDICSEEYYANISEAFNFQRDIIDQLETKLGKDNERVLFRKKFYTLAELEHFELIKLLKENCNFDMNFVFFFYSNEPRDIAESEKWGKILTSLFNKNQNLVIYSFDINLESDLIDDLKDKYNVTVSPTIVVNDNNKLEELRSIEDVEIYLN